MRTIFVPLTCYIPPRTLAQVRSSSVSWLHTQGLGQSAFLELSHVRFFAAQPRFLNSLPTAEIGTGFVEGIVIGQTSVYQRGVKIHTQYAVLFLIKSQPTLQQLHFDDQFVIVHRVILVSAERIVKPCRNARLGEAHRMLDFALWRPQHEGPQ